MWIRRWTAENLVNQATLISEQYHKLLWLNIAKAAESYPAMTFPQKIMMKNFICFLNHYLLICWFLHSYCVVTCLCLQLSPSGHNYMVWILDPVKKKLKIDFCEILEAKIFPAESYFAYFLLSYSSLVLLRQGYKFSCGREIYNMKH